MAKGRAFTQFPAAIHRLAATRAGGHHAGRKRKLDTPQKVAMAQALYADKQHTIQEICQTLRISRATLYRYLTVADRAARKATDG